MVLGVAGTLAAELAEAADVLERHRGRTQALVVGIDRLDARQMQHGVKQHRGMPVGEHEAVAIGPDRILGIEAQEVLPQREDDGRHGHRRARMPRLGRFDGIDRERADRVDCELVERAPGRARRARRIGIVLRAPRGGPLLGALLFGQKPAFPRKRPATHAPRGWAPLRAFRLVGSGRNGLSRRQGVSDAGRIER